MTGMVVKGAPQLMRRFQALSAAARGRSLLSAVQAGALVIHAAHVQKIHDTPSLSKRRAGEPIWLTGNLARSSHIEPGPKPAGIQHSSGAGLGAPAPSQTRVVVHIGTDVEYGPRLEFGFSGADSKGRVYNQPPNPTLRPAWDESKDRAIQKIGQALGRLIAQAAKS